jgi:SAM-dependent methyltransferase
MRAASEALMRRLGDARFATRYFVGKGLDLGRGPDPVSLCAELFPCVEQVKRWDLPDGDAQYLRGVPDASLDFVHASHCLERMRNPQEALHHWFRVLKPGGHLVCVVLDEDLYEQGCFPSTFNGGHKWTFTVWKEKSWSVRSLSVLELLQTLGHAAEVLKAELLDATFRYELPRCDHTLTPVCESAIEFVVRKRTDAELDRGGRLPDPQKQLTPHGLALPTGLPTSSN